MPNAADTAMLMVCAWCRKWKDPQDANHWLDTLPNGTPPPDFVTYGICPACCQAVIDDMDSPSS